MRRVLRIPDERSTVRDEDAHRLFSTSILVSAVRCTLSYVAFPLLGLASGGFVPAVGIPVAVVALFFDALGIRRFWLADHRYRWPVTGIYLGIMVLVSILLAQNVAQLV